MKVNKFFWTILFMTAITSCGGGGGGGDDPVAISDDGTEGDNDGNPSDDSDDSTETSETLSGSVVKGPVTGSTVTFFRLNDDGSKGVTLGTSTTDSNGNYTVTLHPAPTWPFLAETSGGSYVDEATGATTTLSSSDKLSAVLLAGTTRATITPLTHIAAARAQALAAAGTPLATAISSSNIGVATQYGIANIITTQPPAANNAGSVATSTRAERIYALVLAGFAQQANELKVRPIDLANALAEDAMDGLFDGQNAGTAISMKTIDGASLFLPIIAGTADMQSAINAFIASSNNMTNLTQVNIPLTSLKLGINTAGALYGSLPTLPAVESFQSYTTELTATGGTPPYTCALKVGSVLPAGYSLVPSTCQITGTALGLGSISTPFTVTLSDSAVPPASVDLVDLRITTVVPGPTLIPMAGELTVNVSGSTQVASATGGTEPYYFAHDSFAYGAHPLGTTLDVNGNLTGKTSQEGEFQFQVCVIDLVGAKDCQMTSVTVNPEVIKCTPPEILLENGDCGEATASCILPEVLQDDGTCGTPTCTLPDVLQENGDCGSTPAYCACVFDVYSTVFGPGGAWYCHNTADSDNPGFLTSPGDCRCSADLYEVCQ